MVERLLEEMIFLLRSKKFMIRLLVHDKLKSSEIYSKRKLTSIFISNNLTRKWIRIYKWFFFILIKSLFKLDHSLFDLLFRLVSTPKTHVLNHQIPYFTLNIHRMWYCCVLVLILQERAKLNEIRQVWSFASESHQDPLRNHLTRVASTPRGSRQMFPPGPKRAQ